MALIDDFKARFPELCSADLDTAWPGLESSWSCIYGGACGSSDCADEIILNLIAHLFVVGQEEGPSLVASSESVGSVSVTNFIDQSMSNQESFFMSSKYGQQFYMMTKHRHGACFV